MRDHLQSVWRDPDALINVYVLAAIGDSTHSLVKDQKQRTQPWLDTDNGMLEIDVYEAVTTFLHTDETVDDLRKYDM